jgi:hypothetical protein
MELDNTEQLIEEMGTATTQLADPVEGLVDYADLKLLDAAREEILAQQKDYDRRLTLIGEVRKRAEALLEAQQRLLDDGYPVPPSSEAGQQILDNLDEQIRTLQAARRTFHPTGARNVTGIVGEERPTASHQLT